MIDDETANQACDILTTIILELAEDTADACFPAPCNGFQRRMRLAGLATAGRDISILATAGVVVLRRARAAFPPA